MTVPPRTPVLVGVGVADQRHDDPLAGTDAVGLMRAALDAAAADAGAGGPALLDRVDEVIVPEGIWATRDPGRHVLAGRSPDARSVLVAVGVLQQSAFTRAAAAVRTGEADVVVVCGGEAKWRSLRAQVRGVEVPETRDRDGRRADVVLAPGADVLGPVEIERGLAAPTHQYAVMESALRHDAGRSPAAHARHVAALVAGMSEVAAGNPRAWNPHATTVDEVLAAPLVAEPYTKPCCAQWNVDQAAAFVLCAAEVAEGAGVAHDRWLFPAASVESNLMVPLTERAALHRSFAAAEVGRALGRLAGRPVAEVDLLELYSCFPAALQIQCRELGLGDRAGSELTVTGGMHFAGGPLNSFTLQALARIVDELRGHPDATALLTSISGMMTKVGGGLWSSSPPPGGFRAEDVTDAVRAATATMSVDRDHTGEAIIAGYTVGHRGGEPVDAVVIADAPAGTRAVATSVDPSIVATLRDGEWCGGVVWVQEDRIVDLIRR